jgi:hypothetical protein
LPTNPLLLWWGGWLPSNLPLAPSYKASVQTTGVLEFLGFVLLAFGIYAAGALYIQRQPQQAEYGRLIRLVLRASVVIGLIYVFTPALLSRDLYVYAGYGRLIVAHHANPYFSVPAAFPRDPITAYDDWANATSAYGPVWLAVCAFWSLLLGALPLGYLFAFRLFALAAHVLNTLLVAAVLRRLTRPPRTVALGAFLYALNPLALMESGLGAHNDIFMVTLLLIGVVLCLHAEQDGFTRPACYLLPVVAFTLATLVKFTAVPIILFYIVLMLYRLLHTRSSGPLLVAQVASRKAAALKILLALATGGVLALILYAPFWVGHGAGAIISSFATPPSSYFAENSLLRAIYDWLLKVHGLPPPGSWAYLPLFILSQHSVWNAINLVVLLGSICVGAYWIWRAPGTQTLILASLALLAALLIVTPWFFAWYVTWLIALACACLAPASKRYGRALIAFALTFSVTALSTYLFRGYVPILDWEVPSWLLMIVPPVVVFIFFSLRQRALSP